MSHTRPQSRALSRRSVLKRGAVAAAAGATAPVFSGFAGPLSSAADAATLPLVTPKWSQLAVESFGVCAMPLHDHSVYKYRSAWVGNLASMGVSFIRGAYKPGFDPTYETANLVRQHRMKWNMVLVTDLRQSDADIVARVNDIAKRSADVCLAVEGINEPNHNRSGGGVPSNWREVTLAKQKVLWQAVQSRPELRGKPVLGPSLQMQRATPSDFQWFASHGLLNYMTHAGAHCYPAGRYVDSNFDSMLAPLKQWRKPIWVTETGYTNALSTNGGQNPVPESVAGVYAPSAVLEAVDRGWRVNWFEALDDPDAGSKDNVEANYGLYALGGGGIAPPWRAKPAAVALGNVLRSMKDPGPAYRPAARGLRVSAPVSDVRWTALGKRDGSVRLYLRRASGASASKVNVSIATGKGTRSVSVGAQVVSVQL